MSSYTLLLQIVDRAEDRGKRPATGVFVSRSEGKRSTALLASISNSTEHLAFAFVKNVMKLGECRKH